jgi:hypothetical protein
MLLLNRRYFSLKNSVIVATDNWTVTELRVRKCDLATEFLSLLHLPHILMRTDTLSESENV